MENCEELSYFEYWLTKKVWNGTWAVRLISDYIKFKRPWEPTDDYFDINTRFHDEIENKMSEESIKHIFSKRSLNIEGYDENGEWIEGKIDLQGSDVYPKEFIEWICSKGYPVPYEFKKFIGIEETDKLQNVKQQQLTDKEVCQGIARTLWDEYPEMTIEEMLYHKAIQVYGSGKLYNTDTTVRKWLSAVDPRTTKPGRKKNN